MSYKLSNCLLLIIISLTISLIIDAKEISLSSGLGNYTDLQLQEQYQAFKFYKEMNIISASSMLVYNLNEDGTLGIYNTSSNITSSEKFQYQLKYNLGLKAYPCLYCDSTIGLCSNLSSRLNNLYNNIDTFINTTIKTAMMNNWDGFMVDFEPDTFVDPTNITNFILQWNDVMNYYNLKLILWIGGNAPYDDRIFGNVNLTLLSMNTYNEYYGDFIETATEQQLNMYDVSKLGFGLLTNYAPFNNITNSSLNDETLTDIIDWSIFTKTNSLSLWASHISPSWYQPLNKYINA